MKKIYAFVVLFFGFCLTGFAQEKNMNPELAQLAKKDTHELNQFVQLSGEEQADFSRLFYYKHEQLAQNVSEERKEVVAKVVKKKIELALSPEKLEKLNTNPTLFNKLTH